MLTTMRSFFILTLLCLVGRSISQTCPAKYLRFTPQHSYCLPPNRSCHVTRSGVTEQDKELILRLHNQFRSKVAMGEEYGAIGGRLPQAADMMQMEWDDELAAVAQKWTKNCLVDHDCDDCKAAENFNVGQNLAAKSVELCYGRCQDASNEPDWTWSITSFYNEVQNYKTSWLSSYKKHTGPETGHLTQLIWSRSWKVGCGYAYYIQAGQYHKYYACNYGPTGNVNREPVYTPGQPCSACPTNTDCSTSSRGANNFPGLCKMYNSNTAPAYRINSEGLLFYCGFSVSDADCRADVSGENSWNTVESIGGNYDSIVLSGGQSTTVAFKTPIIPRGKQFCLTLYFRKGPLDASRKDQSIFQANYKFERGSTPPMFLEPKKTSFKGFHINLSWGMKTKFSFTFSVPPGAKHHILDIRKIMAYDGPCA